MASPLHLLTSSPLRRAAPRVAALMLVVCVCGCAHDGPTSLAVAAEDYPIALDAARDCLKDHGFLLERVDAAAGVITTRPKGTAGLATPWDGEQSTLYQEWDDFMNRHERIVRIDFEPAGAPAENGVAQDAEGVPPPAPPLLDLREDPQPVTMRLAVAVRRGYRSNWRIETSSIRQSRYYWDRETARRGMSRYDVPIAQDDALAARLTSAIERRMETLKEKRPATEAAGR